ncbi:MAG: helix-hairpin-helix domain-containing protein [Sedimentisphaerales bacterium]|nr:helix-hairpin-helix domain-containing protein [Sedimentisphaerales bacterium]
MNYLQDVKQASAGTLTVVFFAGLILSLCFAGAMLTGSKQINPDIIAKLNPNTACAGELAELPSIGPKKAQAIVDYRTGTGMYAGADDLEKVKGIGKKTVVKIKPWLEFD